MPIQGLKFNILSSHEAHQSFQSTGSFVAYNPNDGVANIALDRTATPLDFDHKLPSQSGGKFPGPINSYLSIYYVDQSGAGSGGQVIVYASPEAINIPYFWSIGRALQSQATSLDIIEGTIPANPGSGILRLWADGTDHLHLLAANGTDKVVIDSGNIGAQTIGGDLRGTIGTAIVSVRNNSIIYAHTRAGPEQPMIQPPTTTDQNTYYANVDHTGNIVLYDYTSGAIATFSPTGNVVISTDLTLNGGILYLRSDNAVYIQWDSGNNRVYTGQNFSAGGYVTAGSYLAAGAAISGGVGDVNANRGNGTGYVFLANSSHYIGFDGTQYQLPTSGLSVGGNLTLSGTQIAMNANGALGYFTDGANIFVTPLASYNMYVWDTGHTYRAIYASQFSIAGSYPSVGPGNTINILSNEYIQDAGGGIIRYACGSSGRHNFESPGGAFSGYGDVWAGRYYMPTGSGGQLAWPNGSYISGNAGYVQGSKEILKEDIEPVPDLVLLSQVIDPRMPVINYRWKDDERLNVGFTVESIEQVLPQLVFRDEDGVASGYAANELVAILWGGLRALEKRVASLEGV